MSKTCYIITYEKKTDSEALIHSIKSSKHWAKITSNTWATVTEKSAAELRDELKVFINKSQGERIFIIKSGTLAAWTNVACSNEWLKNNL